MDRNYWKQNRLSRRAILRAGGIGIAGMAGAALVGCGGGDDEDGTAGSPSGTADASSTGGAQPVAGEPVYGGTLRVGVLDDPSGLDPHITVDGNTHQWFRMLCDNVVNLDHQGVPDPRTSLSESWENVDGTTFVFKLREGVKFHDGSDFDAEIVKLNWERILNPDTVATAAASMRPLIGIEVTDSHTITATLDAPNGAFLSALGDRGGMLSRAYLEGPIVGEGDHVIGTGPFMYDQWIRDSVIRVVKNPNYWGKDPSGGAFPYLDAIETHTIPEANVRLTNLDTGDIDITEPAETALSGIEQDGEYQISTFVGHRTAMIYLNTALAPLDDVRIRLAMAYALDRQAANAALFDNRGFVEDDQRHGPFAPGYRWVYNGSVPGAPNFDLAEARKLVEASGYAGVNIPSFVASNSDSGTAGQLLMSLLQDFWDEIGVTFQSRLGGESSPFFVDRSEPARPSSGFSTRADPDIQAGEMYSNEGFFNPGRNPTAELRELHDMTVGARASFDIDERAELYRALGARASELQPQIIGPYRVAYIVGQPKVGRFDDLFAFDGKQDWNGLWLNA